MASGKMAVESGKMIHEVNAVRSHLSVVAADEPLLGDA
jgi:glycerate-2-kinase